MGRIFCPSFRASFLTRNETSFSKKLEQNWSFRATVHQNCDPPSLYFKCLLTALVI